MKIFTKYTFFSIFLFTLLYLTSCGGGAEDVATESTESSTENTQEALKELDYETQTIEKSLDNCNPDSSNCTYIKFSYPKFTQAPNQKSKELNELIEQKLLFVGGEMREESLKTKADKFIQGYASFIEEMPEYNMPWYEENTVMVEYSNENFICLSFANSSFMGGAHGMYSQDYTNVDLNTGEIITVESIFKEDSKEELNKLVDKYFRESEKIKELGGFEEAGLFDDKIEASEHFALLEDGILFFYNQYEIAPYAMGTFEFVIPYEDLKPLMLEESILNK